MEALSADELALSDAAKEAISKLLPGTDVDSRLRSAAPTLSAFDAVVALDRAATGALGQRSVRPLILTWSIPDPLSTTIHGDPWGAFPTAIGVIRRRLLRLLPMLRPEAPFEMLRAERVYDGGRVVKVDREEVRLPGSKSVTLDMIHHPGASAVVPLYPDRTVAMIRQYRHAALDYILEIPAGKLDRDESPEQCAHREVAEEAGVKARCLTNLGWIYTTPGFTDEVIHLFAATGLETIPRNLDDDEVIDVLRIEWEELLEMIASNEIRDSKTICALMRTDQLLRTGEIDPARSTP